MLYYFIISNKVYFVRLFKGIKKIIFLNVKIAGKEKKYLQLHLTLSELPPANNVAI